MQNSLENLVPAKSICPFSGDRSLLQDLERDLRERYERSALRAIDELIGQKNYPCVPAVASHAQGQYSVGIYPGFGKGAARDALQRDLLKFRDEQKRSGSPYLSFWAVWPEDETLHLDEAEFESAMWRELSILTSGKESRETWDPRFSADPQDKNFCFSFAGEAFFVVGAHAQSSRVARRYRYPAMIFNLYEQFEELSRKGQYESIVKANRARDIKFQGSVNPMVEKHADNWEAIQFSGRANSASWKCPFHRGLEPEVNDSDERE